MKVFLSWSGELSHKIACIFRDWLPSVIQSIKPYVSSEDIDKGTRWSSDIASELESSNYGIIFLTKDNLTAQWINFEAGALSKTLDKANVSPFLFGIKRSEVQGPLLQFQSTIFEKADVFKLVQSINNRLDVDKKLDEVQLQKSFDVWWNGLEITLNSLTTQITPDSEKALDSKTNHQSNILEEILELVRTQQRVLSSPEHLLPKTYLEKILSSVYEIETESLSKAISKQREIYVSVSAMFNDVSEHLKLGDAEKSTFLFDLHVELAMLLDKIKEAGVELAEVEKQKYAKIRERRLIPEF